MKEDISGSDKKQQIKEIYKRPTSSSALGEKRINAKRCTSSFGGRRRCKRKKGGKEGDKKSGVVWKISKRNGGPWYPQMSRKFSLGRGEGVHNW